MENDVSSESECEKPYLILDNHSAHKSVEVMAYIKLYFIPLLMPAYSCEFNSIETLWSLVKSRYKTKIARRNQAINNPEELREFVLKIAQDIPPEVARRIERANSKYI